MGEALGYASNISAGFGDTISFRLTHYVRSFTPGRKGVDPSSWGYWGGIGGGFLWGMAFGAAAGAGAGVGAGEGGAASCFVAGTKVQTEGGEKNIEEVRAGP